MFLENLAKDSQLLIHSLQYHLTITLSIIGVMAFVVLLNACFNNFFKRFGIVPRQKSGLLGIFISPFLHADANHLFYNCIPLFCLMNIVLIQGVSLFFVATGIIILLAGIFIWLGARVGIHIGASALVLGYLGYLLANCYVSPSILNLSALLICIIYLTGLFSSLFPQKKQVSFEGHIYGLCAGIIAYFICPSIMAALHITYRHSI